MRKRFKLNNFCMACKNSYKFISGVCLQQTKYKIFYIIQNSDVTQKLFNFKRTHTHTHARARARKISEAKIISNFNVLFIQKIRGLYNHTSIAFVKKMEELTSFNGFNTKLCMFPIGSCFFVSRGCHGIMDAPN